MYLLVLEFLGTNELLVILVVALILLGPRRLPQMSRKLGKALADFKRTSEDFKRTWEREVEMELADKSANVERALTSAQESILADTTVGRSTGSQSSNIETVGQSGDAAQNPWDENNAPADAVPAPSVTPVDPATVEQAATATAVAAETPATAAPTRKRDWL